MITLSMCLSVCLSVCLSGSHTSLVVTHSYVSQATHAFLGELPLCLCPRHKMARGHLVFALSVLPSFRHSVLPSFRHSVPSKFVFSTPPTSLHGFEWNLAGMLHHKSRSACGEIIHVRQILAELWSLTLRIFTHFSLSSQLLLHPCMDLNETWQGCCTTSLEVHVGR